MLGFLKGKIKINLDNKTFNSGDDIQGTVTLTLKKPQGAGEIYINLTGMRKTTQGFGNSRKTHYEKVFDKRVSLDKQKSFTTGETNYSFKFKAPDLSNSKDTALTSTLKAITRTSSRVNWNLKARLDIKGFDITKNVSIRIN